MNIFGNATQSYKGIHAQPATGGLSGLLGSLFGGTAPSYKSVDGRRANAAQPSAGWWQALSKAPSYKTAPRQPVAQAQEVMPICDAPFADNGDVGAEQTCVCAPADATQIVILDE